MSDPKHTPGPWTVCLGSADAFTKRIPIKVGSAPAVTILEALGAPQGNRADANARLAAAAPDLAAVAEAALLFHGGGEWDEARALRWKALTGSEEATTRVLCDFARAALQKAGLR